MATVNVKHLNHNTAKAVDPHANHNNAAKAVDPHANHNTTAKTVTGPVNQRTAEAKTGISLAKGRQIMDDLNKEFIVGGKKHNRFWIELAKKGDGKVKVFDSNGSLRSFGANVANKDIKDGDIMEIQSAKYGTVRIQVDGDGALGSGQDFVLSVGNKSAASSIGTGVSAINNLSKATTASAKTAAHNHTDTAALAKAVTAAPVAASQKSTYSNGLFSENELRNLIAAILHRMIYASDNNNYWTAAF